MTSNSSRKEQQEQFDWELRPGGMLVQRRDAADDHNDKSSVSSSSSSVKINVSHGAAQHQVSVPAHSSFGDLKRVVQTKTGLEPKQQKILFRGKEKEDGEYLHEAGVKDNSKVLVLEDPVSGDHKFEDAKESEEASTAPQKETMDLSEAEAKESEEKPNVELKQTEEMSKAFQDIAAVRAEVDGLAERISALEVALNGGTMLAEQDFVISSELLMRQLLKLDAVEAEGEARMQRKAEVRRIQNFHQLLDTLKDRNAKSFNNKDNAVLVTTEWETFDSGVGSLTPPVPVSSSTKITEDWERFD